MEVKRLNDGVTLVGVDYLSKSSFDTELIALIDQYEPDLVGLALCEKRFETLEEKESWLNKPLLPSYKEGDIGTLMYQAFMDAVRENLRKFKKIEPETHIADLVDLAEFLDVHVEFIDRDVTLTFKRTFGRMSPLEKLKMAWYFRSAMLSFSDKTKFDSIEGIDKKDDLVDGVLGVLDQFAPEVAEKMRRERIEYMSKKIHKLSKDRDFLAFIPQSKLDSITAEVKKLKKRERARGETFDYSHLEKVGRRVYRKVFRYASPVFFIGLAVYLFFFSDVLNIWHAWLYWFAAVGGMASVGALIGRGHVLSILTSFALAPFMSMTLIGPGWIAGYVEARVRNPTIEDIHDLTESKSVNEFLSNDLIKPLMVGFFSNVFTWIGLFILLPILISFS